MNTILSGLAVAWKTVFFYVFGVFWVGLWAYLAPVPIAIVERFVLRRSPDVALSVLHHGIKVTWIFYRLAANISIDSTRRAPEGSVVVICNHHSYFDIYLLLHVFPRIRFSARRTLFWIPFLGWAMALLGHFPHDADDPSDALHVGEQWLSRGRYVGIFPEGTRAPEGVINPFRSGAFRLAQRTTQRIQPVIVVGTGHVWRKKKFWIRRLGPIRMRVLPAVPVPASLGRRALRDRIEEVRAMMEEEHRRLGVELADARPEDPA